MDDIQVLSLEEAKVHIMALTQRADAFERRVRALEKVTDTFVETVWWRRWLFVIDGWSGHRVVDAPRWRPWRNWWRS